MNKPRNRITIPGALKRQTIEAAREFRKNPTHSEELLWQAVRGKKLNGIKFRRQQPIGPLIVDFYAPSLRLVVEIDGPVHQQQQEADQTRQAILEGLDLKVIRFSSHKVETDLDSVLSAILEIAQQPSPPTPLQQVERGENPLP